MAIARVTKITASSTKGVQDAIETGETGLGRASETLRGITGLEVLDQKAKVEGGKITEYRATIEITFVLD